MTTSTPFSILMKMSSSICRSGQTNDDGTGGVFVEVVPGAVDEDFQEGKRGLRVDEGLDVLADVEMGESFRVIDKEEAVSTVDGTSKVATAGAGTRSVMSLDD